MAITGQDLQKRREQVAMQLRDKSGLWLEMGKKATWYSKTQGKMLSGTIVATDGVYAYMMPKLENPTHRPMPYAVPLATLGMISPKATLKDKNTPEGTEDAEKAYAKELRLKYDESMSEEERALAEQHAKSVAAGKAGEHNNSVVDGNGTEKHVETTKDRDPEQIQKIREESDTIVDEINQDLLDNESFTDFDDVPQHNINDEDGNPLVLEAARDPKTDSPAVSIRDTNDKELALVLLDEDQDYVDVANAIHDAYDSGTEDASEAPVVQTNEDGANTGEAKTNSGDTETRTQIELPENVQNLKDAIQANKDTTADEEALPGLEGVESSQDENKAKHLTLLETLEEYSEVQAPDGETYRLSEPIGADRVWESLESDTDLTDDEMADLLKNASDFPYTSVNHDGEGDTYSEDTHTPVMTEEQQAKIQKMRDILDAQKAAPVANQSSSPTPTAERVKRAEEQLSALEDALLEHDWFSDSNDSLGGADDFREYIDETRKAVNRALESGLAKHADEALRKLEVSTNRLPKVAERHQKAVDKKKADDLAKAAKTLDKNINNGQPMTDLEKEVLDSQINEANLTAEERAELAELLDAFMVAPFGGANPHEAATERRKALIEKGRNGSPVSETDEPETTEDAESGTLEASEPEPTQKSQLEEEFEVERLKEILNDVDNHVEAALKYTGRHGEGIEEITSEAYDATDAVTYYRGDANLQNFYESKIGYGGPGRGIYMTESSSEAGTYGGNVVEAKLRPGSKIATAEDLKKDLDALDDSIISNFIRYTEATAQAAFLGYDALDTSSDSGFRKGNIAVVNPSALVTPERPNNAEDSEATNTDEEATEPETLEDAVSETAPAEESPVPEEAEPEISAPKVAPLTKTPEQAKGKQEAKAVNKENFHYEDGSLIHIGDTLMYQAGRTDGDSNTKSPLAYHEMEVVGFNSDGKLMLLPTGTMDYYIWRNNKPVHVTQTADDITKGKDKKSILSKPKKVTSMSGEKIFSDTDPSPSFTGPTKGVDFSDNTAFKKRIGTYDKENLTADGKTLAVGSKVKFRHRLARDEKAFDTEFSGTVVGFNAETQAFAVEFLNPLTGGTEQRFASYIFSVSEDSEMSSPTPDTYINGVLPIPEGYELVHRRIRKVAGEVTVDPLEGETSEGFEGSEPSDERYEDLTDTQKEAWATLESDPTGSSYSTVDNTDWVKTEEGDLQNVSDPSDTMQKSDFAQIYWSETSDAPAWAKNGSTEPEESDTPETLEDAVETTQTNETVAPEEPVTTEQVQEIVEEALATTEEPSQWGIGAELTQGPLSYRKDASDEWGIYMGDNKVGTLAESAIAAMFPQEDSESEPESVEETPAPVESTPSVEADDEPLADWEKELLEGIWDQADEDARADNQEDPIDHMILVHADLEAKGLVDPEGNFLDAETALEELDSRLIDMGLDNSVGANGEPGTSEHNAAKDLEAAVQEWRNAAADALGQENAEEESPTPELPPVNYMLEVGNILETAGLVDSSGIFIDPAGALEEIDDRLISIGQSEAAGEYGDPESAEAIVAQEMSKALDYWRAMAQDIVTTAKELDEEAAAVPTLDDLEALLNTPFGEADEAAPANTQTSPFEILEDTGASGDGYHSSGPWGKYGAAGILLRHVDGSGNEEFLIVQRGPMLSSNKGKWQLPGGAMNSKENAYQGAAREAQEELGLSQEYLASAQPRGEVVFDNGNGWSYTNIAADVSEKSSITVDGSETSDAMWVTKEDLAGMKADGELVPAFANSVDDVVDSFNDSQEEPEVTVDEDIIADPEETSLGDIKFNVSAWTKTGGQQGSNEGGTYEDPATGQKYYVKKAQSDSHARNEVLANALYNKLGISAAEVSLGSKNGELQIVSKMVADASGDFLSKINNNAEYKKKVQEGFAADAWLANWDVAGLNFDNVVTDTDGNPVRIDAGGALLYRAQGAPKGDAFGSEVVELETLKNSHVNAQSAAVFGSMSDLDTYNSAQKLKNISDEEIISLVGEVFGTSSEALTLTSKLINRKEEILGSVGKPATATEDQSATSIIYTDSYEEMLEYLEIEDAIAQDGDDFTVLNHEDAVILIQGQISYIDSSINSGLDTPYNLLGLKAYKDLLAVVNQKEADKVGTDTSTELFDAEYENLVKGLKLSDIISEDDQGGFVFHNEHMAYKVLNGTVTTTQMKINNGFGDLEANKAKNSAATVLRQNLLDSGFSPELSEERSEILDSLQDEGAVLINGSGGFLLLDAEAAKEHFNALINDDPSPLRQEAIAGLKTEIAEKLAPTPSPTPAFGGTLDDYEETEDPSEPAPTPEPDTSTPFGESEDVDAKPLTPGTNAKGMSPGDLDGAPSETQIELYNSNESLKGVYTKISNDTWSYTPKNASGPFAKVFSDEEMSEAMDADKTHVFTIKAAEAGSVEEEAPENPYVKKSQHLLQSTLDTLPTGSTVKSANYYGSNANYFTKNADNTWSKYKKTATKLMNPHNDLSANDVYYALPGSKFSYSSPDEKKGESFVTGSGEIAYVGDKVLISIDGNEKSAYTVDKILKGGINVTEISTGTKAKAKPKDISIDPEYAVIVQDQNSTYSNPANPVSAYVEDKVAKKVLSDKIEKFAGAASEEVVQFNESGQDFGPTKEYSGVTSITPTYEDADTESPMYNQPKPSNPGSEPHMPDFYPPAAPTGLGSWDTGSEWLTKVDEVYINKPQSTSTTILNSSKSGIVNTILNTPDMYTLEAKLGLLLGKEYITTELYDEAVTKYTEYRDNPPTDEADALKAHEESVAALKTAHEQKNEDALNEYKEKKSKYDADIEEWTKANPLSALYKPFSVETSNEAYFGGPVDWTKAHKGTVSGQTAFDKIKSDTAFGTHGTSVAMDSTDIEGLKTHLSLKVNESGEEVVYADIKTTIHKGGLVEDAVKAMPGVSTSHGVKYFVNKKLPDGRTKLSTAASDEKTTVTGLTYTYTDVDLGAKVTFTKQGSGDYGPLDNRIRIELPKDSASPEALQKLLEDLGVRAAPASEGDIKVLAENALLSRLGDHSDVESNPVGTSRQELLEKVKTKYGVSVDDVGLITDELGQLRVELSDEAAQKLVEYTNADYFVHELKNPNDVDRLVSMMSGVVPGVTSSYNRWTMGIGATGQSSQQDQSHPGGDGVFAHFVGNHYAQQSNSMSIGVVVDANIGLKRLDKFHNTNDSFGVFHGTKFDAYKGHVFETIFKGGIPLSDWKGLVTGSSITRDEVIARLKAMGITEINGVPIENFITLSHSALKDFYADLNAGTADLEDLNG